MVSRAVASEDKLARRGAILRAGAALFLSGDGSLPAAARIADAAGLAKGTVYLYFRTKEEIFAALLLEGWGTVMDEVAAAFTAAKGRRAAKVAGFLAAYVRHLDRHPELLRLDALGYGLLEKNMDPANLRAFKLDFVGRLATVGAVVDGALRLPDGRGVRLLMRTYALTRGLWQSSQPYEGLPPVRAEPALACLYPEFGGELLEALEEYWRGALAPP